MKSIPQLKFKTVVHPRIQYCYSSFVGAFEQFRTHNPRVLDSLVDNCVVFVTSIRQYGKFYAVDSLRVTKFNIDLSSVLRRLNAYRYLVENEKIKITLFF